MLTQIIYLTKYSSIFLNKNQRKEWHCIYISANIFNVWLHQIMGLLRLHNCVSQFPTITLFPRIYICWFCFSRQPWLIHPSSTATALTGFRHLPAPSCPIRSGVVMALACTWIPSSPSLTGPLNPAVLCN